MGRGEGGGEGGRGREGEGVVRTAWESFVVYLLRLALHCHAILYASVWPS